jgi:hypothetical protein
MSACGKNGDDDVKSVRSITSSMNEAKYAGLKRGYNPI